MLKGEYKGREGKIRKSGYIDAVNRKTPRYKVEKKRERAIRERK
jgi:hypothetical protein